jgi:hypothetical protein
MYYIGVKCLVVRFRTVRIYIQLSFMHKKNIFLFIQVFRFSRLGNLEGIFNRYIVIVWYFYVLWWSSSEN